MFNPAEHNILTGNPQTPSGLYSHLRSFSALKSKTAKKRTGSPAPNRSSSTKSLSDKERPLGCPFNRRAAEYDPSAERQCVVGCIDSNFVRLLGEKNLAVRQQQEPAGEARTSRVARYAHRVQNALHEDLLSGSLKHAAHSTISGSDGISSSRINVPILCLSRNLKFWNGTYQEYDSGQLHDCRFNDADELRRVDPQPYQQ